MNKTFTVNRDPNQPVAVCIKVVEEFPIWLQVTIRPFNVDEEKTSPVSLDSYRVVAVMSHSLESNWPAFKSDINERFPNIEAIYLNDSLVGLRSWFMADMIVPLNGLIRGLLHLDEE